MVQSKLLLNFKELKHFFAVDQKDLNLKKSGFSGRKMVSLEQIHGKRVVFLKDNPPEYFPDLDGMITQNSFVLNIRTADCLPIFFYDPKRKIIAAVHAGWKGLCKGIIENALREMKKKGSHPTDVFVSIGPHIRHCCYQVPFSRIKKFLSRNKELSLVGELRQSAWFMNLEKIASFQLISEGIPKTNIDILPFCTFCQKQFSSVRRNGQGAPRMFNLIGFI